MSQSDDQRLCEMALAQGLCLVLRLQLDGIQLRLADPECQNAPELRHAYQQLREELRVLDGFPPNRQTRLIAKHNGRKPYLKLDGVPYFSGPEVAIRFVAALIELNGAPLSFTGWLQEHPEFESVRSDRVIDRLDPDILELIERGGKGKPFKLRIDRLL